MTSRFVSILAALALGATLVAGCDDPPPRPVRPGADGGSSPFSDEDGDGIPDEHEGRSAGTDTDGDGTPDFRDSDSDDDGIPDMLEGGAPGGMPIDSDGDGTADFRDLDSDGNGIPDATEGSDDPDMDSRINSSDTDDDGDLTPDVMELGADPTTPLDSDGDGTPDYRDTDSDNDTIGDRDEVTFDTDADGTADRLDLDTDADGIPDSEEAGDPDLFTPPRDTDADGAPDFRDNDADNDGISDGDEVAGGTDPFDDDSDDDGVSDLVETASGTDPLDGTDSPRSRGDFVFLEPYMEAPAPPRDTLDFATNLQVADVYFLMDTTGSMGGAIAALKTGLSTPGTGIIDRVRAVIPDVWFGVGGFDDYQVGGYGYATSCDRAYYNLNDMTMDVATAQAAVNLLTTHYGGDGPESLAPALYAVASGLALRGESGWAFDRSASPDPPAAYSGCPDPPAFPACPAGSHGWPCFRAGAVPIVVAITDIDSHNGPDGANNYTAAGATEAPLYPDTIAALTAGNVRVIGIAVYGGGAAHLNRIATDTGAVDAAGLPLVTTWSGGAIGDEVVTQIQTLAMQTPIDISVRFVDDPSDGVDTFASFVDHIEANTAGDAARGCVALPAVDSDGDGHVDTFQNVTPGTRVCFDIVVKQNDTVMPTTMPQLFRATMQVVGDGFTELDSRDVFFLVPPEVEPPGGPG